jgi:hypothetical protein
LLKAKLKAKCPKNTQELKTAAVKAEHHHERNPASGDVYGFQSLTAKDLQPSIKTHHLIYDYVSLSNYF